MLQILWLISLLLDTVFRMELDIPWDFSLLSAEGAWRAILYIYKIISELQIKDVVNHVHKALHCFSEL